MRPTVCGAGIACAAPQWLGCRPQRTCCIWPGPSCSPSLRGAARVQVNHESRAARVRGNCSRNDADGRNRDVNNIDGTRREYTSRRQIDSRTSGAARGAGNTQQPRAAFDREAFARMVAADLRSLQSTQVDITQLARRGNAYAPVFSLNLALRQLGETGHWQEALRLLDWMASGPQDSKELATEHSYAAFLSGCGPGPSLDAARNVWRRLTADGSLPPSRVCVAILGVLGRAGEVGEALDLWRRMSWDDVTDSVFVFNAMLSACAGGGAVEPALEVWSDHTRAGAPADAHSLALVLTACDRGGRWARGCEIATSAEAQCIRWDAPAASCIIAVAGRAGRMDLAQSTWLRCMAEHDAGGPIMLSGWLGNAFLSACAHNGALSAASMAQSALLARGIPLDARGYTSIMGSALRDKTLPTSAERLVHVRAALAALLDAGLQPTALTLNVLLVALGDCGLCSEAETVVTEWLQRYNVTTNAYVYNTLIRCRVRCTQVPQAMHLFREMQANQVLPTSVTFALLLKACNAEGMQTAAEELRVLRQSLVVAGMLVEEYDADEEWQQPLSAEESFAPGAFWAAQSPPKPMIRPHPRGRVKRQDP